MITTGKNSSALLRLVPTFLLLCRWWVEVVAVILRCVILFFPFFLSPFFFCVFLINFPLTARISHTSEPKARLAPTSHLNPIAATQMSMQSSTAPRKRSPFSVCSRHAVAQEPGAKLFWMFRPEHAQMVFFAEKDHIPGSVEARELEELYVWEPPRRSVPLCIACTTFHKRVAAFEYEPRGRAFYCEHHCPRTGTPVDVYERLRCRDCAARGALQLALFVCPLCRCMLCEACAAAHDPAHACIDARTVETARPPRKGDARPPHRARLRRREPPRRDPPARARKARRVRAQLPGHRRLRHGPLAPLPPARRLPPRRRRRPPARPRAPRDDRPVPLRPRPHERRPPGPRPPRRQQQQQPCSQGVLSAPPPPCATGHPVGAYSLLKTSFQWTMVGVINTHSLTHSLIHIHSH